MEEKKSKINFKDFAIIVVIVVILMMVMQIENKDNTESNSLNDVQNIETSEDTKSKYFVLYKGREIKLQTGKQLLADMELNDENTKKYNSTFYTYEKGKYIGEKLGEFNEPTYEGVSVVGNIDGIGLSEKYNIYPRSFNKLTELPKEIKEKRDYTSVEINEIDLDGDGKNEYIVCYIIEDKEVAKSEIVLYNSEFEKVDRLVYIDEGFWLGQKDGQKELLNLNEYVEYADIDKDGNMEILIDIPMYESNAVSIYKFEDGKVIGDTNCEIILMP